MITKNKLYPYRYELILFIAIILTYFSSFYSGPLWDDYVFIFENEQITKNNNPFVFFNPFANDHRAWPLGYTFFWFMYKVLGTNWVLYKLLNIIIHLINTLLILKILKKENIQHPFVISLIFAIHPLHIETVSWIFQFNTMTSMTFLLLSFRFWKNNHDGLSKKNYFICLFFFSLSLMTKSYAIFVPLYFWSTLNNGLTSKLKLITPFLLVSILAGISTIRGVTSSAIEHEKQVSYQIDTANYSDNSKKKKLTSLKVIDADINQSNNTEVENIINQENVEDSVIEVLEKKPVLKVEINTNKIVETVKNNWTSILLERYMRVSNNFGFYFSSFFTFNDRYLFQPPFLQNNFTAKVFNLFAFTSLIIAIALITKKHTERLYNARNYMVLLLALFLPISGIVYIPFMKYSPVADHWFYLAILPLAYLLIEFMTFAAKKFKLMNYFRSLHFIFAIPLVFFSIESFRYGSLFNDHERLFLSNIDAYPHNVFLYRYLAQYYEKQGDKKNAKKLIEQGLMLHPTDIGLIIDRQRIIK